MPTQHTLVPVGMMGVQTAPDSLQSNLQQIHQGDTSYNPEACNAVQAYQEYYAYPPSPPPPPDTKLARAKAQYKNFVQKASNASSGRMKCLVADFTQKKAIDDKNNLNLNYFFDGMPPSNMTPNVQRVRNVSSKMRQSGLPIREHPWCP